jgi:predicted RNA-binding Zn ribbon-like protein
VSWHLVDGVRLPHPVAGHPALDFCNTRAGWGGVPSHEYLISPRALVLWAAEVGLTGPVVPESATTDGGRLVMHDANSVVRDKSAPARVLARAKRLREALYAAAAGRACDADWQLLTREAVAARRASRLVPRSPGARWQLPDGAPPADLALHAVAAAAEDFLTSPLAASVSACPGEGCGWLFADPRGRRRWCEMAVCGNRAKARRHRTPS